MTELERIGSGIKEIRKRLNLTLADLAVATGFSISYLSKIERNQGNITLEAISKICAAFNIDLIEFLCMDFDKDVVLVHKNERSVIYFKEGLVKEELLTSGRNKQIRGLMVTLYPRSEQIVNKIGMQHTTDEFAFILKGEMLFIVEDKHGATNRYILREGDSFYLYAGQRHWLSCLGNKDCVSIWSYVAPSCFTENMPIQH